MSQENVAIVRRLYMESPLFEVTDEQIDSMFGEYVDEGFEIHLPPGYPEGQLVFRGREGIDQLRAMLKETWDEWRFEPERYLDAHDRVVVFVRVVGRGAASGAPFEMEVTHVWTIRAGRARSIHVYRNRSEALEAAGLSE
jgi:ketosteroid isomerase-like protein